MKVRSVRAGASIEKVSASQANSGNEEFRARGPIAKREPTVESRRLGAVGQKWKMYERQRRGTILAPRHKFSVAPTALHRCFKHTHSSGPKLASAVGLRLAIGPPALDAGLETWKISLGDNGFDRFKRHTIQQHGGLRPAVTSEILKNKEDAFASARANLRSVAVYFHS